MESNFHNKGRCIWLTGLSGSGKTTLALLLEKKLRNRGLRVKVLDIDAIQLGCNLEDRRTSLLRIASAANLMVRDGLTVIVAAIIPHQIIGDEIKERVGSLVECFVDAPLEVCVQRDPHGFYARSLTGEIKHVIGLDDSFKPPEHPEIIVSSHLESPEDNLALILRTLELLGCLPPEREDGLTVEEAAIIEKHLRDLGYL